MFHQFDKELREKCIRGIRSLARNYDLIRLMIWDISFPKVSVEILEWVGNGYNQ